MGAFVRFQKSNGQLDAISDLFRDSSAVIYLIFCVQVDLRAVAAPRGHFLTILTGVPVGPSSLSSPLLTVYVPSTLLNR